MVKHPFARGWLQDIAMSEEQKNLAANVAKLRNRRGWSQQELGRRAGVGQRTVSNAEAGKNVSMKSAGAIAQALGVSLIELLVPPGQDSDSLADKVVYMVAATRGEYRADQRKGDEPE